MRRLVLLLTSVVLALLVACGVALASVLMARPADAALTCGPSWQSVPLPTGLKYPQALTPIAANDIWVVGNAKTTVTGPIATAHWNGSNWTLFSPPQVGSEEKELNGVDGVASDDVWAVGAYTPAGTNANKTLVEHWNGSKWVVVASPNVGGSTTSNTLTSVDALSRTSAWAVGESFRLVTVKILAHAGLAQSSATSSMNAARTAPLLSRWPLARARSAFSLTLTSSLLRRASTTTENRPPHPRRDSHASLWR